MEAYDALMGGGLYDELTKRKLLVRHEELESQTAGAYKILKPEVVPVITYPFEWAFSQLKDAALATLEIQKLALDRNMTLRDASAYNIQFISGRPCLIDTLSFGRYKEGDPWDAYRQFCQHFLAPLALMSYCDPDLLQLMRVYIDGIPLSLASKLLPFKANTKLGLLVHLKMHAGLSRKHAADTTSTRRSVSKVSLLGLLENLEGTIRRLKIDRLDTEWGDYYEHTNYSTASRDEKAAIIHRFAERVKPKRVLDLGSNNGYFSRVAAETADCTISSDIDPMAVEGNYLRMKSQGETDILPMLVDLTNPSPALGWSNQERSSFSARVHADLAMALALIHHLAISNNLPFEMISKYFAELASYLIIEFVPKSDSQVKRLLVTREDIFPNYTPEGFEAAFSKHFTILETIPLEGSERILYLMRSKVTTE